MDAEDEAEFDQAHGELVKLRNQSELEARFDAFAAQYGPLVLEGIDAGAEIAAPFVPGGSLGLMAEKAVAQLAKGAFTRWLAKQKPAPPAA